MWFGGVWGFVGFGLVGFGGWGGVVVLGLVFCLGFFCGCLSLGHCQLVGEVSLCLTCSGLALSSALVVC